MKAMKILLSAALVAAAITGCTKEKPLAPEVGAPTTLTIKFANVTAPKTRVVDQAASQGIGTITLEGAGHIFVLNGAGNVIYNEALDITEAVSLAGQMLDNKVPNNARVYIVANVPAADYATLAAKKTLDAIQAFESTIDDHDFRHPALANSDMLPKAIDPNQDGTALVDISLAPLVARIELHGVRSNPADGANTITAFNVTGVYLDDYLPAFNYKGEGCGTLHEQGKSTTFAGIGDSALWAAAGSPLVSTPGVDKVWGYHVAAGALPRFIVQLEGVEVDNGNVTEIVPNGTDMSTTLSGTKFYVTMNGYSTIKAFERGKIYRIGTGTNPFEFTTAHLGLAPNTTGVQLNVKVQIEEWQIEVPEIIM